MTASVAALVSSAFAGGLRPEADVLVSDWADQFRFVSKPSPEHGQWRTSRVPYMREIMDRLSPSDPAEIVPFMKAAQGAGSEGGLNAVGCWMHRYPDNITIVCPTIDAAKKFSHMRFDRMVEATPVLQSLVAKPRSRESSNNVLLKEYGEGRDNLVFTGANSGVGLRSYPSRYVDAEEVDGYPFDLDNEGSSIDLIIQRTAAFYGRKIYLNSTPTLKGHSHIDYWFQAGDQNEYNVPCPLCRHMQNLVFGADRYKRKELGGLRWPKGSPDQVKYQCEKCGDGFEEWRKVEVLPRGEWRPSAPGKGGVKIRSYHAGALIYPYGWPGNAWENLAADWERAYADPVARKSFVNLKEGLPWADPTEVKTDADTLLARAETYGPEVPAGAAILIAVVDVQGDRLEVEIIGVGAGEEVWSMEYRALRGDTSRLNGVWEKELDPLLKGEWLSETGISMSIKAVAIDAGYNQATVMKFCEARKGRNIWAIKGKDGYGRPLWPVKSRRRRDGSAGPVIVGVDTAKEIVHARLRIVEPGPGCCHFLRGTPRDQFEMLLSEVRIPDYSGPVTKFSWKKIRAGVRNEWLDIRAYLYALLRALEIQTSFRLDQEAAKWNLMAEARRSGRPAPAAVVPRRAPAAQIDDPYFS